MPSPAAETPDGRLELLEARVLRLEEALRRLSAIPGEAAAQPAPPAAERAVASANTMAAAPAGVGRIDAEGDATALAAFVPKTGSILAALSALGTSFLVLGGAFLIRTITEAGVLPTGAGIAVGYAYALGVIASADRVARTGRRILAGFLLATAIGIGHPLVYEAVTRFHAIGPGTASLALVLLAGACLAAARHRALPAIAWGASLAMAASCFVLAWTTGGVAPFAAALLAVGVAVEWTPGSDGWRSARWPSALAADGMLLWLAARPDAGAPLGVTAALLLALPLLYVGGIAARTFATNREVGAFEVFQSFAASAIGLGGSYVAIGRAGGSPVLLGATTLITGVGGYVVSLGPLSRTGRPRANASLAGALALGLALFGSACILSGQVLAWVWLGFTGAMAAAAVAGRPALRPHVSAFACAAGWQSGLLAASLIALLAPRGRSLASFPPAAFGTIALSWIVLGVAAARGRRRAPGGAVSRLALAVIAGLGTAGLTVALAAPFAAARVAAGAGPATLALLRSATLAAAALTYAACARRWSLRELGGLAYAMLVLWGVKLLIEDVPYGRPLTLFVAFALYGTTILWVPKLLRSRASPADQAAAAEESAAREVPSD